MARCCRAIPSATTARFARTLSGTSPTRRSMSSARQRGRASDSATRPRTLTSHNYVMAEEDAAQKPRLLLIMFGLVLGMFVASLDQTIVSTALPTVVREQGGLTHLSWVVTGYVLAATPFTP